MSRPSSCSCSLPLVIVAVFAFNDANYPAPPWRGFTLDWFLGSGVAHRVGLFADAPLMKSVATSVLVACWVTVLSVVVGTANAFLLERADFRGKSAVSLMMLAPLVIPGVILGISILAFASRLAQFADDLWGFDLDFLRPGLPLVVARTVFVHRIDCDAHHRRPPQALRPDARGSRVQPRRVARRGAVDGDPSLPQAGADRRRRDLVPDVVRELQHDADAGGVGRRRSRS